eukprot:3086854-Rhodomonas_salina.2
MQYTFSFFFNVFTWGVGKHEPEVDVYQIALVAPYAASEPGTVLLYWAVRTAVLDYVFGTGHGVHRGIGLEAFSSPGCRLGCFHYVCL